MFDANYSAFVVAAGALVISPGASMAVVTDMAIRRGRFAALMTVAGINIANSSLALSSMLGLSAVLHHWPWLLRVISAGGAVYLAYLGVRALLAPGGSNRAGSMDSSRAVQGRSPSPILRGVITNLLNPSVVLFYMLLLPGFIAPGDPFFRRFLLLAGTHVSMSIAWLSTYSAAVGTLSVHITRPRVRRTMEVVTGAVLLFLGVKLVFF